MPAAPNPLEGALVGTWWDADRRKRTVAGVLELHDDRLRLRCNGWPGSWAQDLAEDRSPETLYGLVHGEHVTLLNCFATYYDSVFSQHPPATVTFHVGQVLSGAHLPPAQARIARADVRLDHLTSWGVRLPLSRASAGSHPIGSISYAQPPPMEGVVPGASLKLERVARESGDFRRRRSIETDDVAVFRFTPPVTLKTLHRDYVSPLRQLIALAVGSPVFMPSLELIVGDRNRGRSARLISVQLTKAVSEEMHSGSMRFTADTLGFDVTVRSWWSLHPDFQVIMNLHEGIDASRGFLAERFLTAATALEGYHRTKYPGPRIKYADRLRVLAERAGQTFQAGIGVPGRWEDAIVAGRDGLSHRDPQMINVEDNIERAVWLIESMEWLLTLLFLQDLGLSLQQRELALANGTWGQIVPILRQKVPDLFV
jgi:hypothetical protein